MEADWRAMLTLMRELYPQDRLVRLAWEYYHNDRHKSRLVRGIDRPSGCAAELCVQKGAAQLAAAD